MPAHVVAHSLLDTWLTFHWTGGSASQEYSSGDSRYYRNYSNGDLRYMVQRADYQGFYSLSLSL